MTTIRIKIGRTEIRLANFCMSCGNTFTIDGPSSNEMWLDDNPIGHICPDCFASGPQGVKEMMAEQINRHRKMIVMLESLLSCPIEFAAVVDG